MRLRVTPQAHPEQVGVLISATLRAEGLVVDVRTHAALTHLTRLTCVLQPEPTECFRVLYAA